MKRQGGGCTTLRAEIWKIVDEADRKDVLINSTGILGSLKRDVAEASFASELSHMVKEKHIKKRRSPKGVFARRCPIYKPGLPLPEEKRGGQDRPRKAIGFMALARLREAKKAARGGAAA